MDQKQSFSKASGGRGVYLVNTTTLTRLATEIQLGLSPGPGTWGSLFLATNSDHAYDNAVINWYVKQDGRRALFATTTIAPVDNAQQPALVYPVGPFATDAWEVTLTLTGGTLPAVPLRSGIAASGVESGAGAAGSSGASYTQTADFTGPAQTGEAAFDIPEGAGLFLVSVAATIDTSTTPAHRGLSYGTAAVYMWQSTTAVARLVPVILVAPASFGDTLMATMVVPTPDAAAEFARVTFTTPTGISAGDVVRVTVSMLPLAAAT
jgi:hypothetical protein